MYSQQNLPVINPYDEHVGATGTTSSLRVPFNSSTTSTNDRDACQPANALGHTTAPYWFPPAHNAPGMALTAHASPPHSSPPSHRLIYHSQNPLRHSNHEGHTVRNPRTHIRVAPRHRHNPIVPRVGHPRIHAASSGPSVDPNPVSTKIVYLGDTMPRTSGLGNKGNGLVLSLGPAEQTFPAPALAPATDNHRDQFYTPYISAPGPTTQSQNAFHTLTPHFQATPDYDFQLLHQVQLTWAGSSAGSSASPIHRGHPPLDNPPNPTIVHPYPYPDGTTSWADPFYASPPLPLSGLGLDFTDMVDLQGLRGAGEVNAPSGYTSNDVLASMSYIDNVDKHFFPHRSLETGNMMANQPSFPPTQPDGSYLAQNALPTPVIPKHNLTATTSAIPPHPSEVLGAIGERGAEGNAVELSRANAQEPVASTSKVKRWLPVLTPDHPPHVGPSSKPSRVATDGKKTPTPQLNWEADLLQALSAQGQKPIPNHNNTNFDELSQRLKNPEERQYVEHFEPFGLRSTQDPSTFYYPIDRSSILSTAADLIPYPLSIARSEATATTMGFLRVTYNDKFFRSKRRGRRTRRANFDPRNRGCGQTEPEMRWLWYKDDSPACGCGKVFTSDSSVRDHAIGRVIKAKSAGGAGQRDTSKTSKGKYRRKTRVEENGTPPSTTHPIPVKPDRERNTKCACYIVKQQLGRSICYFCGGHLAGRAVAKDWKAVLAHLQTCRPLSDLREILHLFHCQDDGLTKYEINAVSWPILSSQGDV